MAAGRAAGQPGEGEEAGELERESRQPEQAGQVPHTHCIQLLKGQRDWDVSKHTCGQSWSVLREAWKLCRSSLLPLFLWFLAKTAVPCHVPSKPSLRVAFAAQILPALLFPSKITWLAHAVRPSRQWCQVQGLRPAQWGACQVPARGPCSMWKSLVSNMVVLLSCFVLSWWKQPTPRESSSALICFSHRARLPDESFWSHEPYKSEPNVDMHERVCEQDECLTTAHINTQTHLIEKKILFKTCCHAVGIRWAYF